MFRSKHEQNLPSLEAERLYGAAAASRAGFCGVACAAGLGGGTGRGSDLAGTHQEWIAKMAGNSDQEDQRKKKKNMVSSSLGPSLGKSRISAHTSEEFFHSLVIPLLSGQLSLCEFSH